MSELIVTKTIIEDFETIINDTAHVNDFHGKNILLTGVTGVIGKYFLAFLFYLRRTTNQEFMIYCLGRSEIKLLEVLPEVNRENYSFITHDLSLTTEISIDRGVRFDYIFHLASPASPVNFGSKLPTLLPNLFGTYHLLKLLKVGGRFLFTSTTGVYGEKAQNLEPNLENVFSGLDPLHPISCYLEGKRAAETLISSFCSDYPKFDYKIARLSICFGPGISRFDGRLFSDLTYALFDKTPMTMNSAGIVKRNFTYLSDCISGLLLILQSQDDQNVFNLASEESFVVRDLVEYAHEDFGLPKPFYGHGDESVSRFEAADSAVSTEALKSLGWTRRYSTMQAFRRTVGYLGELCPRCSV